MAATVFDAAADFIERSHEAGDWHWPQTLMEDLFYSDELEALLPSIESRARRSTPFRRQLAFTGRSIGGKGGPAAERFLALAREFEPEFANELSG